MHVRERAHTHPLGVVAVSENIVVDVSQKVIRVSRKDYVVEDHVTVRFASILEDLGIRYVVVAGYVAILFGRARRSDDIDFIVEPLGGEEFTRLCRALRENGFTLMQGDIGSEESIKTVYKDYLARGYAVRFMYDDVVIPNIEFKYASNPLHEYSLNNAYTVVVNNEYKLRIAPLELQIAYKLYLGSDKDIGDAVFLYELFKPVLRRSMLREWCRRLGVDTGILERVREV